MLGGKSHGYDRPNRQSNQRRSRRFAAGAAMPDKSLGTLGNSLAGVARGGIVGVILQAIAPALQGGEGAGSIIGSIVGPGAVCSWPLFR